MLLPLRQDDDVVDGPLVVAVPRVQWLPPAEAGGGGLGRQRQLIVDEAVGRGVVVVVGLVMDDYWLNTAVVNQYQCFLTVLQLK